MPVTGARRQISAILNRRVALFLLAYRDEHVVTERASGKFDLAFGGFSGESMHIGDGADAVQCGEVGDCTNARGNELFSTTTPAPSKVLQSQSPTGFAFGTKRALTFGQWSVVPFWSCPRMLRDAPTVTDVVVRTNAVGIQNTCTAPLRPTMPPVPKQGNNSHDSLF
ncbi:hypothetical protein BDK51DRAFT_30463 [Blyttiomyces helicus]|uniref:Uncharacterized protein n=1 Tax=Blyttiomyces helicus TaxID=388810 RepID=A0A4P9WPK6_9FUNG|nr:hypothetical protein BDK51DRAFT_30463 [Blyttiomyces helicus]|eukprot:RKO94452.1 hypothetical protein BDK51DRAFT_30463 [Blyttiomyces helicus]